MATIKSYTDISQSKKLAKILPPESTDMHYISFRHKDDTIEWVPQLGTTSKYDIPCWSLSSLLGVLPNDTSLLYFDDAYQMVYDKKPYVISNKFDNPIDACYEIILKLNELNLL